MDTEDTPGVSATQASVSPVQVRGLAVAKREEAEDEFWASRGNHSYFQDALEKTASGASETLTKDDSQ